MPRIDVAVDCGATVLVGCAPQMQGAAGGATRHRDVGEMTFKDGRAQQYNFHTYEVTRMSGAPRKCACTSSPGH